MSFMQELYICTRCALRSSRTHFSRLPAISQKQRRRYSVKPASQGARPFRMAVLGSGPAGFYTAYRAMSKIENAVVDMYEYLPVPFGLVRFGVAPDHPEVKNCQEKFTDVAQSPNFNFIGNVPIGTGSDCLPLTSIAPHYDAILFAYGASKDRTLDIPGEDILKNVYSARGFVGWYNGLPEYADLAVDLSQGEEAVVIGQGNVALDVARILLTDIDALRKTDITEAALETLSQNRIKKVRVVGRRGPMQAAFTIKEARELMNLPSVAFEPIDMSLIPPDVSKLPRAQKRIMQLLLKGTKDPPSSAAKSWSLDFKLSPKSFNASAALSDQLSSVTFERTDLYPDAFDPYAKVRGTGRTMELPASFAFRSIGYKSEALQGLSDLGIAFDDRRGIIPNDGLGRVLDLSEKPGQYNPGMYCAGWVKNGPTGVIATTMNDAFLTADAIADDWYAHAISGGRDNDFNETRRGWAAIAKEAETRGRRRVSWQDWERIDKAEQERGKMKGKFREKFTRIADMLAVLD